MNLKSIINQGLISVYLPVLFFVISCVLLGELLMFKDIIIAFILLVSIAISWIWWGYQVVKWKYWAFSSVSEEESHKLYIKAIEVGLIWPSGSLFNKTEIWSKTDRVNWSKIEPKIQEIFKSNG